jgi:hypothetical protein
LARTSLEAMIQCLQALRGQRKSTSPARVAHTN